MRKLLLTFATFFLCACQTPYKPYGTLGGYDSKEIRTGVHFIEFTGNNFTDFNTLEGYFKKRAAEICGSNDFKLLEVKRTSRRDAVLHPNYLDASHPIVIGTVQCQSK